MSIQYLTDLSQGDKPWDVHRKQTDTVTGLYVEGDYLRHAERLNKCSQWLIFACSAKTEEERVYRLRTARFCRVRHCPICQWRRSLSWIARFYQVSPALTKDFPKARWVFLTLTVRNCPIGELREAINRMNKGWDKMRRAKAFPALGFIKSIEVTPGLKEGAGEKPRDKRTISDYDFGYAHPHFHVLLMVNSNYFTKNYMPHAEWVKLWQRSLGVSYEPWVDVRTVKPKENSTDNALISAARETFKYTIKPEHLTANSEWLLELTRQIDRIRGITLGGVLKGYLSESDPTEKELTEGNDAQDRPGEAKPDDPRYLFNWRADVQRYASKMERLKDD